MLTLKIAALHSHNNKTMTTTTNKANQVANRMNDFDESKPVEAQDGHLDSLPIEMTEDAKKKFNMICFGCTFSGEDRASFKERGTNGSSAVAINTVSFNESKRNLFVEMTLAFHALGPPGENDSSAVKRERGVLKKKCGSVFYTMKDYDVVVCTEPDGSTNLLLKKRERLQ